MRGLTSPLLLLLLLLPVLSAAASGEQQGMEAVAANTVPALPVARADNGTPCRLDLSAELFGGVAEACGRGRGLDRSRCCPVLAAWLYAAHARSALEVAPQAQAQPQPEGSDAGPMMPDDNQRCVDALERALERREIRLARPNATCDAVICFCGIRLHQITSLRCPAAFDIHGGGDGDGVAALGLGLGLGLRNATPTAEVRDLERSCRNASYAGCTRCLQSLQKVKSTQGVGAPGGMEEERGRWMMGRDCQLMGLTWLLARNKTAFIPTVSAVLRAMLYTTHPPTSSSSSSSSKCSPDQENMPLAVDSLQFQHLNSADDSTAAAAKCSSLHTLLGLITSLLLLLPLPFPRPHGAIF